MLRMSRRPVMPAAGAPRGGRLPLIMQGEPGECGLACLAMVAEYYGRQIGLVALRCRTPALRRGMSLEWMIEIAAGLGFDSRSLWVESRELAHVRTPCVLHWDACHFVVLRRANARHSIIHDPLLGVRRVICSDLAKHFSRVALELWPAALGTRRWIATCTP